MEIEWLGPYQIVGKLGRGGMGTVYEGVNRETGEAAAVKLLSASLAQEGGFRTRFEAEIEALRKLNHPNIVRLFGFGEQEGHLFYAMELVDGSSLEEELRQGRRFEWTEVVRIALEVCQALRHAHDRGIVHRDIKPGNLLLANEGTVKLSDFGIARLFGSSGLTCAGSVVGTAEYMAPEQAEGRPVDARADLYSLGVVMYVLLARRPVFSAKSLPEMLHKHRYEQPVPIRAFAPDTPAAFERILAQLLQKDPNARIPNANVLTRRLEEMLEDLSLGLETLEAEPGWFSSDSTLPTLSSKPGEPPVPDANSAALTVEQSGIDLPGTQSARLPSEPPEKTISATPVPTRLGDVEPATKPSGRFIPVAEEELDYVEEVTPRPALISWQTWALVLALAIIAASINWSLKPATADALYKRITVRTADGLASSIFQAEKDIQEFLNTYPGDHRAGRLREYEREIELYRLERTFDRRVKGSARTDDLLPIEQEYLEAITYVNLEPERGVARLQALVDLYGRRDDVSGPTGQCLLLAQRRLAQLRREIGARTSDQRALLAERLDAADRLRATDPQAAQSIYRAVVELYAEKYWAADFVQRARAALDPGATTENSTSQPQPPKHAEEASEPEHESGREEGQ